MFFKMTEEEIKEDAEYAFDTHEYAEMEEINNFINEIELEINK